MPLITCEQGQSSNEELLEAMNKQFEHMYNRMDENKKEIKKSLSISLKAEVNKQVTERTHEMKEKISRVLGDEIINMQEENKTSTNQLEEKMKTHQKSTEKIMVKMKKMEDTRMLLSPRWFKVLVRSGRRLLCLDRPVVEGVV